MKILQSLRMMDSGSAAIDLAFNNVKPEDWFFLSLIRFDSGQD